MSQTTTTSPATPAELVLAALSRRLRVALEVLDPAGPDRGEDPGVLVAAVVAAIRRELTDDRIWLALTAVAGCYPTRTEVDATRRAFELGDDVELAFVLLDHALALAAAGGNMTTDIRIVADAVLVDVDHTAAHDLHTGIQRVVREVLPVLAADHDLIPVRWTANRDGLTGLSALETRRVMTWWELERRHNHGDELDQDFGQADRTVLVPWRSVLMVVEVPPVDAADRIAALGDKSGNKVTAVIHDVIPVVSADMVPSDDTTKFVRYLTAVKFAARVAGVSEAATDEIKGFTTALATQGLAGPLVACIPEPTPPLRPGALDHPRAAGFASTDTGAEPSVLVIGSHEPRKNHLAVLHAAEVLWREGLRFRLEFIGGSGWGDEFPRRVAELTKVGRPVRVRRAVPEAELRHALAVAAFTVFPSLHEGFGLPVAESLTFGTPVLTADFGSTAEIARGGGCVTVDPRDDVALTNGMRAMMTEPGLLARLTAQIGDRPVRTWPDYAAQLWAFLIQPELDVLRGVRA